VIPKFRVGNAVIWSKNRNL